MATDFIGIFGLRMLDALTGLVFFGLLIIVLFINIRSPLNRACAYLLLSFFIWAVSLLFIHNPLATKEQVKLYYNFGCLGWGSFASLAIYFSLILTENKDWLRNVLLKLALILAPAIVIWSQWTERLWSDYVVRAWGWSFIWQVTGWPFFYYSYLIVSMALVFSLLGRYWLTGADPLKRGQTVILLSTGTTSLVLAFLVDVILPRWGYFSVPNIAPTFILIFAFGLIFAISRYRLILAEKELIDQAEREWTRTFDAISEGISIQNLDNSITNANQALCRLLGKSKEELIGSKCYHLFHGHGSQRDNCLTQRTIDSGQSAKTEFFDLQLKKWLQVTTSPIYGPDKNPLQIVQIVRDITEKRQLEEAINRAHEFLDKIINTVAAPIFVKNRQHKWIMLNDAYCKFIGYKREELLGKSNYEFFPKKEADIFWIKDEEVFRSGRPNINEETFTDADGVTHFILTKKVLFKDTQGDSYIVGTITDLSEHHKLEQLLAGQKGELEQIINSVPVGIFYKNAENNFVWVNDTYCQMMGVAKEKLIGQSLFEFYPREQAGAFWQDDQAIMAAGQPKYGIIEPLYSTKGLFWVRTDKLPYRNASGKVVGILGLSVETKDIQQKPVLPK